MEVLAFIVPIPDVPAVALQAPPPVILLNVVADPTHTAVEPVMAGSPALTVTTIVAVQPPPL